MYFIQYRESCRTVKRLFLHLGQSPDGELITLSLSHTSSSTFFFLHFSFCHFPSFPPYLPLPPSLPPSPHPLSLHPSTSLPPSTLPPPLDSPLPLLHLTQLTCGHHWSYRLRSYHIWLSLTTLSETLVCHTMHTM